MAMDRQRTLQFNREERRKSLRDPAYPLDPNNSFPVGAIAAGTFDGRIDEPVTVSFKLRGGDISVASGMIFFYYSTVVGIAAGYESTGDTFHFAFPQLSSLDNDSWIGSTEVFGDDNQTREFVMSWSRDGGARLWMDGVLKYTSDLADTSAWALAGASGQVGDGTPNILPAAAHGTLTGIDIIGGVKFHLGQLPLQHNGT